MAFNTVLGAGLIACALFVQNAFADGSLPQVTGPESPEHRDDAQTIIDRALDLIGIRYRRGGNRPETGFDCSGLVHHVFRESLGLVLPRNARDISKTGTSVAKTDLMPGDLVFFNTMRHAFSHVGIYLGNHQFVHSPRSGETVGIADLRERYWARRYDGARRIEAD